jgi:chromosome segregation ATPase
MEFDPFQGTIAAIAELQKRIKVLEEDGSILSDEYKSLCQRIESRQIAYGSRKASVKELRATAGQVMDATAIAEVDLQESRKQRESLRSKVADLQRQLNEARLAEKSVKTQRRRFKSGLPALLDTVSHCELLLGSVFAQPPHHPRLTPAEVALIGERGVDLNALPLPLERIVRSLQDLPLEFAKIGLVQKRKAALALLNAWAAVTELNAKVKHLELELKKMSVTPQRFETESTRLSVFMLILAMEIKRFQFV